MLIENPEALKSWLTSCLGRLCDADPAALSKYVMALVKKDKPENELKDFCLDQLDVFLLKDTKAFVELLFETLKSKAYLQPVVNSASSGATPLNVSDNNNSVLTVNTASVPVKAPVSVLVKAPVSSPVKAPVSSPVKAPVSSPVKAPVLVVDTQPVSSLVKVEKKRELQSDEEPVKEAKRFAQRSRSSSKSRSENFGEKAPKKRSRSRDSDGHRRRQSDERRHHQLSRRPGAIRRSYRSRRHGDRNSREKDRQRSRSPSCRSRSTSYERSRSRSYSSSSDYSRSRSRGRSKDYSGHSDSRNMRKKADDIPQQSHERGETDYRLGSSVTNTNATICRVTEGSKHKVGGRNRCHDYDEQGYCMRGDQCPFDHGNDPLIVDDVSVLNFNAPVSQAASNSSCSAPAPSIALPKPPGVESPIPPLPPVSPPPPPPPPQLTSPGTFAPEPYNPETPGLFAPKHEQMPFWSPSSPPPLHPPLPPCPPPAPGQAPILPSRMSGVPAFNLNEPPPPFHTVPKVQRTRELIGVPTLDSTSPADNGPTSSTHQMASLQRGQTNTTHVTNTVASVGPAPSENTFKRKPFDYSRLGAKKPMKRNNDRCVLELRKVPKYLNSVTHLSNHFSQFGVITNIMTNIDNDPEAALVFFSNHAEAAAAYRHKEAVLHNRFIKVFWHNKDGSSMAGPSSAEASAVSTSNDCLPQNVSENPLRKDSGTDVTSTTPVSHNENRPINMEPVFEHAATSNIGGTLSRTIFINPAMLRRNIAVAPVPSTKPKEPQRMETLKRKLDLHKKKQSILQLYVEHQKVLIEKLRLCKNETDKDSIKTTINDIRLKILKLQSELKKDGEEIQKMVKVCNGANAGDKTETEKELLDAEMDLYNRQHKGDDVSEILSKVLELKQQAINYISGLGRARGAQTLRPVVQRYRGRGRSVLPVSRCVDHRPKKILISNVDGTDLESLRQHFLQYGDIESIEAIDIGVGITFHTRKAAEVAITWGSKFGELILEMTWYHDSPAAEQPVQQENFPPVPMLNQGVFEEDDDDDDDDEEEDSEARSWRR